MRRLVAPALLGYGMIFGQSAPGTLSFEAATIKASSPNSGTFARTLGGPGTKDPGRIRYSNMPLRHLLLTAYDVEDVRLEAPGWMEDARFDVEATISSGVTREQFRAMLGNLLVERFRIALHREKKSVSGYALAPSKDGHKLKNYTPDAVPGNAELERDADGFPKLPAGSSPELLQFVVQQRARLAARGQSMADFAGRLSALMGRPVADETNLAGTYDFALTFSIEGTALGRRAVPPPASRQAAPDGAEAEAASVSLLNALQEQLGLKLEAKRVDVEMIVIDRADKVPAAN